MVGTVSLRKRTAAARRASLESRRKRAQSITGATLSPQHAASSESGTPPPVFTNDLVIPLSEPSVHTDRTILTEPEARRRWKELGDGIIEVFDPHVFVCTRCRESVSNPGNHLKDHHGVLLHKSSELFTTLDWRPTRTEAIEEVPFVDTKDGFTCRSCCCSFEHKRSHSHVCTTPDIVPAKVQRIGRGSHKRTVAVKDAPAPPSVRLHADAKKKILSILNTAVLTLQTPATSQEINPFYMAMNWFVKDEELVEFADHQLHQLFEPQIVGKAWVQKVLGVFHSSFRFVEQLQHFYLKAVGYRHISDFTQDFYCRVFVKALCFTINVSMKSAADSKFPYQVAQFPGEIEAVLSRPDLTSVFNLFDKIMSEVICSETIVGAMARTHCVDPRTFTRKDPKHNQPFMSALLKLFRITPLVVAFEICSIHGPARLAPAPAGSVDAFMDKVHEDVVVLDDSDASSESEDGDLSSEIATRASVPITEIENFNLQTSVLPGLPGGARATVDSQTLQNGSEAVSHSNPSHDSEQLAVTSACRCPEVLQRLIPRLDLLDAKKFHPINLVVSANNLARTHAGLQKKLFEPDPGNPFRGIYNNHVVFDMEIIKTMYVDYVAKAGALIDKILDSPRPAKIISRVKDDMADGGAFYHARAAEMASAIIERVVSKGQARLEGNSVIFDQEYGQQLLTKHHELTELLLFITEVGGGLPGRVTELAALRFVTKDATPRNVFVLEGRHVVINPKYTKTRWASRGPSGVDGYDAQLAQFRFYEEAVSELLVLDFLVCRPLMHLVASHLVQKYSGDYLFRVFVSRGFALDGVRLGKILAKSLRAGGLFFGARCFRQIYKYYVDSLFVTAMKRTSAAGVHQSGKLVELNDFRQALATAPVALGHASKTSATQYGVQRGAIPGFSSAELTFQKTLSMFVWAEFLGHVVSESQAERSSQSSELQRSEASGLTRRSSAEAKPVDSSDITALSYVQGARAVQRRGADYIKMANVELARVAERCRIELFGEESHWKSPQQAAAVKLAMSEVCFLAVLPTGGGKSAIFSIYSRAHEDRVTLVLVPTCKLQEQIIERTSGSDVLSPMSKGVVVLTYSEVQQEKCAAVSVMHTLRTNGRLARIFMDEAHVLVTDSFRDARVVLPQLGGFFSLTLLTGSAPPHVRNSLTELFSLEQTLLASTDRPEISFVVRQTDQSAYEEVVRQVRLVTKADERVIVFVNSPAQAREYAGMLTRTGIYSTFYHASETKNPQLVISREELAANAHKWNTGEARAMVATTALCAGIDHPHVRRVIVVGLPYNFVDFFQMAGRAGRDGLQSACVLLFCPEKERSYLASLSNEAKLDKQELLDFALLPKECCRRACLTSFMDGPPGITCDEISECAACDLCLARRAKSHIGPRVPDQRPSQVQSGSRSVIAVSDERPSQVGTTSRAEPALSVHCLSQVETVDLVEYLPRDLEARTIWRHEVFKQFSLQQIEIHELLALSPKISQDPERSLVVQAFCALCFAVADERVSHPIKECPRRSNNAKCTECHDISCLHQVHWQLDCPFRANVKGYCAGCWLPEKIGASRVHAEARWGNSCPYFRAKLVWIWRMSRAFDAEGKTAEDLEAEWKKAIQIERAGLCGGLLWLMLLVSPNRKS